MRILQKLSNSKVVAHFFTTFLTSRIAACSKCGRVQAGLAASVAELRARAVPPPGAAAAAGFAPAARRGAEALLLAAVDGLVARDVSQVVIEKMLTLPISAKFKF